MTEHSKNDDSVPQLDGAADDCTDGATVDKESRQNVFGSDYRSKVYCDKTDVSCMDDHGSCLDDQASDDSLSGDIAMIAQLDGTADGESKDNSVNTQSDDVINQSDDVTIKSGDVTTKSGDVNTKSGDINTQSDDVNTQSGDVNTKSGDINTQSDDVNTQSGDVNTQSDDILTQSVGNEATDGIIIKGAGVGVEKNQEARHPGRPRHPVIKRQSGVPPNKGYVCNYDS